MEIGTNYQQHVEITKKLKMSDSFYEVREPHKEAFEEIYHKAKDENVNISNAKDFLNSLTKDELSTLQNYTLLADEINVNSINDEGAYNLLLHHYEKYDFNKDGVVSNGIAKGGSLLPENMPPKEKTALVKTLNEMDEKDRFVSMMMLNPPHLIMSKDGAITTAFNNAPMDYNAIMKRIEKILNPQPGEVRSDSILKIFAKLKEMFHDNYEEKNNKKEQYHTQQKNDINVMKAKLQHEIKEINV